jgi:hypothetical protein
MVLCGVKGEIELENSGKSDRKIKKMKMRIGIESKL